MRFRLVLDTQRLALEEALGEAKSSCGDTKFSCEDPAGISYEVLIPAIARQLLRMQRRDPKRTHPREALII
jgi:hypothetical protein